MNSGNTDIDVVVYTIEDTDLPDLGVEAASNKALLLDDNQHRQAGHSFRSHETWHLGSSGVRVSTKQVFDKCLSDLQSDCRDALCFVDLNLGRDLVAELEECFTNADLPPRVFALNQSFPGFHFAKKLFGASIAAERFVYVVFANTTLSEELFGLLEHHPTWAPHAGRFCAGKSLTMATTHEQLAERMMHGIDAFLEAKGYGRSSKEKLLAEFDGWFPAGSAVRMALKHNYNTKQKPDFVRKLSKLFRVSISYIDALIANTTIAGGIWNSLKGITGVTAKHSARSAQGGTTGIGMGGVAVLAAAYCPTSATWLRQVEFQNAPGDQLLSSAATVDNEDDLWNALNAFFAAIIPNRECPRESNIKEVRLMKSEVKIELNESFDGGAFDLAIRRNHGGDACTSFEMLKRVLDGDFSKCAITFDQTSNSLTFKTRRRQVTI